MPQGDSRRDTADGRRDMQFAESVGVQTVACAQGSRHGSRQGSIRVTGHCTAAAE